jgi:tyrosyl-tRNA synthetase
LDANLNATLDIIGRGAVDLITRDELIAKLATGRRLRVKYGADPSAPDLHLGHMVQFRALRDLQRLGHEIIFIVGDFTAMLGDPSGRSQTRPQLSREQVDENARTYIAQVARVLDISQARIVRNSEWLAPITMEEMLRLTARHTVARMLERDDFAKRYAEQQPISISEFMYPLMQAYDSVAIEADIELGGTDQKFNFLLGRQMQQDAGQEPQVVITRPLIPGTDGIQKMSKSLGNYIAIGDPAPDMYGKLMSLPDRLMPLYFELLTDVTAAELKEITSSLADGSLHPKAAKERLASLIVGEFHGAGGAAEAKATFDCTFVAGGPSAETAAAVAQVVEISKEDSERPVWVSRALVTLGLAKSNSEARRLIGQGAVMIDAAKIADPEEEVLLGEGTVVRVGKRRIARVAISD